MLFRTPLRTLPDRAVFEIVVAPVARHAHRESAYILEMQIWIEIAGDDVVRVLSEDTTETEIELAL